MKNATSRSLRHSVDWQLIFLFLLLVLIGWINIYASVFSEEPGSIFDWGVRSGKQFVWILSALGLAALILFVINPRWWEIISPYSYLVVLFLLVLVIFVSRDVKGSHSWFSFGPINFQPAELSKTTTSLLLAAVMSRTGFRISNFRHFLPAAAVILVPMLVIIAEQETGSALVYTGFLFALYREGLSGWLLGLLGAAIFLAILCLKTSPVVATIVLGGTFLIYLLFMLRENRRNAHRRRRLLRLSLGAVALGLILIFSTRFAFDQLLAEYQRQRIEVLLGIREDLAGAGYNVHQSMIAIGSGGFWGKGFLQGTQTSFGFVPEQSTDFIFCTIGEEWGFVGCFIVILLYVLMIRRIVHDAEESREAFTRIYGFCLAACLFMHLFINIGMTIGLMPVIGIPLPFLSYGGSSLWSFTLMLFIFIALNRQENKYF